MVRGMGDRLDRSSMVTPPHFDLSPIVPCNRMNNELCLVVTIVRRLSGRCCVVPPLAGAVKGASKAGRPCESRRDDFSIVTQSPRSEGSAVQYAQNETVQRN